MVLPALDNEAVAAARRSGVEAAQCRGILRVSLPRDAPPARGFERPGWRTGNCGAARAPVAMRGLRMPGSVLGVANAWSHTPWAWFVAGRAWERARGLAAVGRRSTRRARHGGALLALLAFRARLQDRPWDDSGIGAPATTAFARCAARERAVQNTCCCGALRWRSRGRPWRRLRDASGPRQLATRERATQ